MSTTNCGYLMKQDRVILRVPFDLIARPCMQRPPELKSARSMYELDNSEELSESLEVEKTWMLSELSYADGVYRDPRESAILGGGTPFRKINAVYAGLLSKGQASAIVCTDMFNAMAIVRQREGTTLGKKFLWYFQSYDPLTIR